MPTYKLSPWNDWNRIAISYLYSCFWWGRIQWFRRQMHSGKLPDVSLITIFCPGGIFYISTWINILSTPKPLLWCFSSHNMSTFNNTSHSCSDTQELALIIKMFMSIACSWPTHWVIRKSTVVILIWFPYGISISDIIWFTCSLCLI